MYDVAIIGGGPGASAAAVYAARKLLKTVLLTDSFGGQSVVSEEIQNWIGTEKIAGAELAKTLEAHVRAYAGDVVEIYKNEWVTSVTSDMGFFKVTTKSGKTFEAKTVLVSTGGSRKKLEVPGAAEFDNRGLSYCASCDGPLFSGMDVAVVGGGNAGFETAAQLLAYCKSVTLLQRSGSFNADPITVEKVLAHPNMRGILNTEILEVVGEKFVTGLKFKHREDEMEFLRSRPEVAIKKGYIDRCEYTRLLFPAAGDRYIPTLKLIPSGKSKIFMPGSSLYREYNWNSDGRLVVLGKRPRKKRGD
jgi:alkyl hydroperoxide reductase subunit F